MNQADSHLHGSREVWDQVFEEVDLSYSEKADTQGKLFELIKINFLEEIFPKPGAKMLEVGSGTGFVSLYFGKRGYSPTLLDTSKKILETAEENFKKEKVQADFVVGDAEKLPFPDESFDIVTSFGLLEHFEEPSQAIGEMGRVLKTGGLFFADIVPKRFSVQSFGNIFNAVASISYWSVKGKPQIGLKKARQNFSPLYFENSYSIDSYIKMMEKAGVKGVKVRGNRPFPRLTLPKGGDKLYAWLLKPTRGVWKRFDRWDHAAARFWGAGWWFWGQKEK